MESHTAHQGSAPNIGCFANSTGKKPWATESEITTFRDCRNTKKDLIGKTWQNDAVAKSDATSDPKV
jgi:hypothetical protein